MLLMAEVTQQRGGGGGGDGTRATISPQAFWTVRLDHGRLRPTINEVWSIAFSFRVFALRVLPVSVSCAVSAASFAARTRRAGEQPGRERPHPRTPDPDPRVGSGVAHVPAAGDDNGSENRNRNARRIRDGFVEQNAITNPVGIAV